MKPLHTTLPVTLLQAAYG